MQSLVAVFAASENDVTRIAEVVAAGGRQCEPVAAGADCRFKYCAPGYASVVLPRILHCRECSRHRDRPGTDQGSDSAPVVECYFDGSVTTFVVGEAFTRHSDIAVDGYRIEAVTPDRNECTATQRANARFSVDRQKGGSQCAVNGVSTNLSDFTGRIGR